MDDHHERATGRAGTTQGPWVNDSGTIRSRHGEVVAVTNMDNRDQSEAWANACVLAAALDLLDALSRCRPDWIHSENAARCLGAIAKATLATTQPQSFEIEDAADAHGSIQ